MIYYAPVSQSVENPTLPNVFPNVMKRGHENQNCDFEYSLTYSTSRTFDGYSSTA